MKITHKQNDTKKIEVFPGMWIFSDSPPLLPKYGSIDICVIDDNLKCVRFFNIERSKYRKTDGNFECFELEYNVNGRAYIDMKVLNRIFTNPRIVEIEEIILKEF